MLGRGQEGLKIEAACNQGCQNLLKIGCHSKLGRHLERRQRTGPRMPRESRRLSLELRRICLRPLYRVLKGRGALFLLEDRQHADCGSGPIEPVNVGACGRDVLVPSTVPVRLPSEAHHINSHTSLSVIFPTGFLHSASHTHAYPGP